MIRRLVRLRCRLRCLLREERGSATAELAITLPLVLLVFGVVVGGVALAAHRVGLTSLAAEVARLEARGDAALAQSRIASFPGNPGIQRSQSGGILCVTAITSPGSGLLQAIRLTARGCAAVIESDS
ncbi:TadE/TadG family type IV pilus assembly protein [Leucobacter sp. CX42]|uniref:TadE/TadG family type IV pilus assembly protein n=1 Tax=unclassified Leucobacter TaxID=2621730 RepID=UPI00333F2802